MSTSNFPGQVLSIINYLLEPKMRKFSGEAEEFLYETLGFWIEKMRDEDRLDGGIVRCQGMARRALHLITTKQSDGLPEYYRILEEIRDIVSQWKVKATGGLSRVVFIEVGGVPVDQLDDLDDAYLATKLSHLTETGIDTVLKQIGSEGRSSAIKRRI